MAPASGSTRATRIPSSGSIGSSAALLPPAPAGSSDSDAAELARGTHHPMAHSLSSVADYGLEPAAACGGAAHGQHWPSTQQGMFTSPPAMIHPGAHFLPGMFPCGFFPAGFPPVGQCAGWYPPTAPFPYPLYPPPPAFHYPTPFMSQFMAVPSAQAPPAHTPPSQGPPAQAPDSWQQSGGGCSGQIVEPMLGERHLDASTPCPAEDASLWTAARVQVWLGSIDAEVGTAECSPACCSMRPVL